MHEITGGGGARAVYDSVGKETFEGSLACLATRGVLAQYGEASGDPPKVDPRRLGPLGSVFLTHPSLGHYSRTREEFLDLAGSLMDVVLSGAVKIRVGHVYPLEAAADAHRDMAARRTTGSVILLT